MSRAPQHTTSHGAPLYGVMAEFDGPAATTHAAEALRDAGFSRWDVYSPFPIHGIDEAMGLKRPILPLVVGVLGITGALVGFGFQYWVATSGYGTVVQGKPPGAWQAFIPVTFEFGVIFTSFSALLGMLAINGLPRWHHPLLAKERFLGVSDDRFVVAVEAADAKFDSSATPALLKSLGAISVENVED